MARRTKQAAAPARPQAPAADGRQAEVLALAAELFARNGYARTTVRDIADAAGIMSGSLYHHFASKEAMVDAILTPFLDEALAACEAIAAGDEPPRDAVRALVQASLDALDRHRAAIVIYQNDGPQLAASERFAHLSDADRRFEAAWIAVVRRGIDRGDFRSGVDPLLSHRIASAALWAVARWEGADGAPPREQIAEQYTRMLLDGIVKPSKKKGKKG